MKTTENIKNIWKKSMIEVTNEVFDEVIKTSKTIIKTRIRSKSYYCMYVYGS